MLPPTARIVDVIRCRARALTHAPCGFSPILGPLDDIQPVVDGKLGDLVFIDKAATNPIRDLGFSGRGWHHRVMAEHCLHYGVINFSMCTHTIFCTGRIPSEEIRRAFETMEQAWPEGNSLQKQAANAMVGCFAIDESYHYTLLTSTHAGDVEANLKRSVKLPSGQILHEGVLRTLVHSPMTMRPWSDQCLSTEAVRMGQMVYAIRRLRAVPYELKTDSALYLPLKRCKSTCLAELTHKDLGGLRTRFEGKGCRRLNEHYVKIQVADSDAPVFRCGAAIEKDRMRCDPRQPRRDWPLPGRSFPWTEVREEDAEAHVLAGSSLLILGIAGTGKTTLMQKLVTSIRGIGQQCTVISKTHTACRRADPAGATADHFCRRVLHGSCKTKSRNIKHDI